MGLEARLSRAARMRPDILRVLALRMIEELSTGRRMTRREEQNLRNRVKRQVTKELEATYRGAEHVEILDHDPETEALIRQAVWVKRMSQELEVDG